MLVLQNDYQRIALVTLFYDIGKLIFLNKRQRLGNQKYTPNYFTDYLVENKLLAKDDILEELVERHYEMSCFPKHLRKYNAENNYLHKLSMLVFKANNYSSRETNDIKAVENTNFRVKNLESIFSKIDIGKLQKENLNKMKYRFKKFSTANIMPCENCENAQDDLEIMLEEFLNEIKRIKSFNFHDFYTNLLDIVQKYTWCIPSDSQIEESDVSLYSKLKNSSAIAMAYYQYLSFGFQDFSKVTEMDIEKADKEDYFLLIGGDVSGIQKYIYSLETTSGIARRLRAKSFFIKMLANIAAYRLIKELDLELANIIISSGGKFYILAPNTLTIKKRVEKLKEEFNDELYLKYETQIFLNMATVSLNGNDLKENFSKKYDDLNDMLVENKALKFVKQIVKNPITQNDLYNRENVKLCPICRKKLILENQDSCSSCELEYSLGAELPNLRKIHIYDNPQKLKANFMSLFGLYAYFEEKTELILEAEPYLTQYYEEKDIDIRMEATQKDFYGGYISQTKTGEVKSFEEISKESSSENLGILKGDVDNLGLIFSEGLKSETSDKNFSISRISFLSTMIDAFFSYWLPEYLSKQKDSYYVVYAGGDDFMIVAAWDKLMPLAKEIKKYFTEFVARNENITLTQGIAITDPKDPIYFSSNWATEAEEIGKKLGKNGVVIFNTYIPWKDYKEVNDLIIFLDTNMRIEDSGIYSQSFLYRLLHYTKQMEDYSVGKGSENLKYISSFYYDTGRNLLELIIKEYKAKGKKEEEAKKEALKDKRFTELEKYFGWNDGNKKEKDFAKKYMRMILNYVIRKNRKVGDK